MLALSVTISFFIFLVAITSIIFSKKALPYLVILITIEVILVASNLLLVLSSSYIDCLYGQIISLSILTIAAAESAIGLAIFIASFRSRGSVFLIDWTSEQMLSLYAICIDLLMYVATFGVTFSGITKRQYGLYYLLAYCLTFILIADFLLSLDEKLMAELISPYKPHTVSLIMSLIEYFLFICLFLSMLVRKFLELVKRGKK